MSNSIILTRAISNNILRTAMNIIYNNYAIVIIVTYVNGNILTKLNNLDLHSTFCFENVHMTVPNIVILLYLLYVKNLSLLLNVCKYSYINVKDIMWAYRAFVIVVFYTIYID